MDVGGHLPELGCAGVGEPARPAEPVVRARGPARQDERGVDLLGGDRVALRVAGLEARLCLGVGLEVPGQRPRHDVAGSGDRERGGGEGDGDLVGDRIGVGVPGERGGGRADAAPDDAGVARRPVRCPDAVEGRHLGGADRDRHLDARRDRPTRVRVDAGLVERVGQAHVNRAAGVRRAAREGGRAGVRVHDRGDRRERVGGRPARRGHPGEHEAGDREGRPETWPSRATTGGSPARRVRWRWPSSVRTSGVRRR